MKIRPLMYVGSGAMLVAIAAVFAQPPHDGQRRGPPGGRAPAFRLGSVLPPFVVDELDLTADQKAEIKKLEAEVRSRLERILTPFQRKRADGARPPGPPGGGPGGMPPGDGPPPDSPRKKPAGDAEPNAGLQGEPALGGIQWFATWDAGRRVAVDTGRPILLVSAAPHCAGVSGIW